MLPVAVLLPLWPLPQPLQPEAAIASWEETTCCCWCGLEARWCVPIVRSVRWRVKEGSSFDSKPNAKATLCRLLRSIVTQCRCTVMIECRERGYVRTCVCVVCVLSCKERANEK